MKVEETLDPYQSFALQHQAVIIKRLKQRKSWREEQTLGANQVRDTVWSLNPFQKTFGEDQPACGYVAGFFAKANRQLFKVAVYRTLTLPLRVFEVELGRYHAIRDTVVNNPYASYDRGTVTPDVFDHIVSALRDSYPQMPILGKASIAACYLRLRQDPSRESIRLTQGFLDLIAVPGDTERFS